MMDLLIPSLLVGFLAEMVDNTLGMAYGVTSNSFLLSFGLAPAVASATVHTAEVFTTAVAGVSHLKFGNVDKKLFLNLVIPGAVAAAFGAYFLVNFPIGIVSKAVSVYLVIMGVLIILRAFGKVLISRRINRKVLAGLGGFLDAVGGGGWGPVVTSTLIANNEDPKRAIGSVNAAEFFVTVTEALVFCTLMGIRYPEVVAGLLAGGVVAAPIGAYVCKKAPTRPLMIAVGLLIIFLNLRRLLC
jgi:uncharacterized membrane protein YfcA